MIHKKNFSAGLVCLILFFPFHLLAQYTGTGSVSQGLATTTIANLYNCQNGRIASVGTIKAKDNTVWTMPAEVNFNNSVFPFASDLNNPCTGANYPNAAAALAALDGSDIITIDTSGEVFTAFVFADNYFEMYINGVAVGKDDVPYTQFNSNIVRFKVKKPFTIAILLVDWEEHLGLGSENSGGFQYHDGDGGLVAVFKNSKNEIIATTGNEWKAQTFYTSPVTDLTCPTEMGTKRLSKNCSTEDSNNGLSYYALHWEKPYNWMEASFDDSSWPAADTYTNATVGVNNKPAYTNFTDIFDAPDDDAEFIWSSNLILDNEVVVRYKVSPTTSIQEPEKSQSKMILFPNPARSSFILNFNDDHLIETIKKIRILDLKGTCVFETSQFTVPVFFGFLPTGIYFLKIEFEDHIEFEKLIIE
ncbi:MAG: T9SS type A sorting domain-containing protein [Saprospiraceae bacterium]|jgi:hypothetical protein|nr:T9SS type A sorting domain-containing protein [Saprospiraceae bacterium]